jgi:hypothetical protein
MLCDQPGRFSINDAIQLMEQRPEEFEYRKGPKSYNRKSWMAGI